MSKLGWGRVRQGGEEPVWLLCVHVDLVLTNYSPELEAGQESYGVADEMLKGRELQDDQPDTKPVSFIFFLIFYFSTILKVAFLYSYYTISYIVPLLYKTSLSLSYTQ